MTGDSARPSTSPLRVLGHRNFALLWSGSLASSLGSSIGYVVVIWLVYTATRSPLAIAFLGVVEFLPSILFGILGGALVDRFDRKRLMIACDLGRFALLGSLAAYVLAFGTSVVLVLAFAFVVAALGTIFRPASSALLPKLLPATDLTDGNGILQSGSAATNFIGSPIGGALVVALGVFIGFALAINALTFAASAALLGLMVVPTASLRTTIEKKERPSLLADARLGLSFIRSQSALLAFTVSALSANFFLAMYNNFEVFYVTNQLHLSVAVLGIVLATNSAGFALGGLFPGRLKTDRAPGIWFAASAGMAGLSVLVLGATASLWLTIPLVLAFGSFQSFAGTCLGAAQQRVVPNKIQGRFFATQEAGAFAMIPAGQIAGGFAVFVLGVGHTFVLAGAAGAVSSFALLFVPAVRRWGRLEATSTSSERPV